jgi:hypothetical protein
MNQINKTNQRDQTEETNEIASSRGKVELMPQDIVARSSRRMIVLLRRGYLQFFQAMRALIRPDLLRLVTNGAVKQAISPYNPKYLLLKMPYRFNTSYQLLAPGRACLLPGWLPSLNLHRSRP